MESQNRIENGFEMVSNRIKNDVVKLADFYKALFAIHNDSKDKVHQIIIAEETM